MSTPVSLPQCSCLQLSTPTPYLPKPVDPYQSNNMYKHSPSPSDLGTKPLPHKFESQPTSTSDTESGFLNPCLAGPLNGSWDLETIDLYTYKVTLLTTSYYRDPAER